MSLFQDLKGGKCEQKKSCGAEDFKGKEHFKYIFALVTHDLDSTTQR